VIADPRPGHPSIPPVETSSTPPLRLQSPSHTSTRGQRDQRRYSGGGLDVLFNVLEIEGFEVGWPMFGEILEPMYSSSGGHREKLLADAMQGEPVDFHEPQASVWEKLVEAPDPNQ
jgi:hypothetical protein